MPINTGNLPIIKGNTTNLPPVTQPKPTLPITIPIGGQQLSPAAQAVPQTNSALSVPLPNIRTNLDLNFSTDSIEAPNPKNEPIFSPANEEIEKTIENMKNKAEYNEQSRQNYRSIINGIDFKEYENDNILKESILKLLENPKILSQDTNLIIDLANSKNKFGLILLEKGIEAGLVSGSQEMGRFTPTLIELLNKNDFEDWSLEGLKTLLLYKLPFLKCFSPKKAISSLKNERVYNLMLNQIFKYTNWLKKNNPDKNVVLSSKEQICFKILMARSNQSDSPFGEVMIDQYPKIIKFLEQFYGDELNSILADPNLDMISVDPFEYGLPKIEGISGNAILIQEGNGVYSYINPLTNKVMYKKTRFGIELNNGESIFNPTENTYRRINNKTKESEDIMVDDTGFANIKRNGRNSLSYREISDNGSEKEIIDMETNDGGVFSKHSTISPNKTDISTEVILKDKAGNSIFEQNMQFKQNSNGNTVEFTMNGKTETFTSQIKDDKVILTHNGETTEVNLKDLVGEIDEMSKRYMPSVTSAKAILDGEFIADKLAQQTVDNFKIFLSKLKADDLLSIVKNKQKIALSQFGYDSSGDRTFDKGFCFSFNTETNEAKFILEPDYPSRIATTHEAGHGGDNILHISENPEIQKIYQEELKNISDEAQYYLKYFLTASAAENGGVSELVAESNAIMNATEMKSPVPIVSVRILKVMQEFPQTIAAIIKKLAEYKAGL